MASEVVYLNGETFRSAIGRALMDLVMTSGAIWRTTSAR